MRSVYILGGAAVGKSTFMAALLGALEPSEIGGLEDLHAQRNRKSLVTLRGHRLTTARGHGVYLGKLREHFPGTDGLDRVSSPVGEEWLRQGPALDFLVAEGTTLATRRFVTALHETTKLLVLHLHCSDEVKQQHVASRGSEQKASFLAGSATRSRNLAARMAEAGARVLTVDTGDAARWEMALELAEAHLQLQTCATTSATTNSALRSSMSGSTRTEGTSAMTTTKHSLKADGAAFNDDGTPVRSDKSTVGAGRALCSCGWVSDELGSRAERKRAHADHKFESSLGDLPQHDAADPDSPTYDEGTKVVSDAVDEYLDDQAWGEDEDLIGAPAASGPDTRVDYTFGRFWDTLGVGSTELVASLGGTAEAVYVDRHDKSLRVGGPEAVQERASTLLPAVWAHATEAIRNYHRTSEQYKALRADVKEERFEAWQLGKAFMRDYLRGVQDQLAGVKSAKRNAPAGYLAGRTFTEAE